MKKALLVIAAVLVVAVVVAYFTLITATSPKPEGCAFALEMKELRALAASIPGDKPTEIRVEDITGNQFPRAIAVAGEPWEKIPFRAYAYQLVYADKTVIVDSGMDPAQAEKFHMTEGYDEAAWQRVAKAMTAASAIYVTHEHGDHMAGAIADAAWAKNLHATKLQLESDVPSRVEIPAEVRSLVQTFSYEGSVAVAPGVVLIAAPGHTPGSQLVYINRADGTEVILTGDTAWLMDNVERQQPPAKMVALLMHANRHDNQCQLAALDHVRQSEPALAIMTGHDQARMAELVAKGVFTKGFAL